MPFRFQRRISFGKFLRLNVSKSGISTSVGPRGVHATFGSRGTRVSVGIPGTGLSFYENLGHVQPMPPPAEHVCQLPECNPALVPVGRALGFWLFALVGVAAVVILVALALA
jgi:hypothetical protein